MKAKKPTLASLRRHLVDAPADEAPRSKPDAAHLPHRMPHEDRAVRQRAVRRRPPRGDYAAKG